MGFPIYTHALGARVETTTSRTNTNPSAKGAPNTSLGAGGFGVGGVELGDLDFFGEA